MSLVALQKSEASFQFNAVSALKRRQPRPNEDPSRQPGGQSTSWEEARAENRTEKSRRHRGIIFSTIKVDPRSLFLSVEQFSNICTNHGKYYNKHLSFSNMNKL